MKAGEIGTEPLITLRFSHGEVVYTYDFRVVINGHVWPRQLKVASLIIDAYKQCTRDDEKVIDAK